MGDGSFPGVKSGRSVTLTTSHPSTAVGHERVELYLYSTYGPYSLYTASVPVQRCTLLTNRNAATGHSVCKISMDVIPYKPIKYTFSKSIFQLLLSSTDIELTGSSSRRRLYKVVQI
jgi:hypothetical protein